MTTRFLLILLALALSSPAAAQSDAIEQLLESAEYWKERGRNDKLVEIWQKILLSEPNHARALAELSRYYGSIGRNAESLEYRRRLEAAHPDHPSLNEVGLPTASSGGDQGALAEARRLAAAGRTEEAIARYRQYFGNRQPAGELALEYYPTLGGTPEGWDEARRGLERVAKDNPNNRRAVLAFAKHLTYREPTRRSGISRLAELGGDPGATDARSPWKDALMWLQATPADAGAYEKYLSTVGEDAEIRERLSSLGSSTTVQRSRTSRVDEAWAALEADNLDRAEAIFSRAVQRDPRSVDATVGLAMVHMRRDNFSDAAELLLRAKKLAPDKPEKWERSLRSAQFWQLVREAEFKVARGEYEEAESLLVSAQASYPDEVDHAEVSLGRLYTRLDRFADADAVLARVFEREPDHPSALAALVELRVREGRSDEAQVLNKRLALVAPSQAVQLERIQSENLRVRALFERDIGQLDRAISLLIEARKLDDDNLWALFDLAQVYAEFGETVAARGAMEELLLKAPDTPEFQLAHARLQAEDGQYAQALQTLDSLPAGPMSEEIENLRRRVRVHVSARNALEKATIADGLVEARRRMTSLERDVEGAPELMAVVASAWAELGDYEEALRLVDAAVTQSLFASVGLRLQRIAILLQAGRHGELEAALAVIRDEPDLSPRELRDLERLRMANFIRRADAATEAGDPELALLFLRPLLREDPENPKVLNALGRQLFAAGRFTESLAIFSPLVTRDPDDMEARQGAILASLRMGKKRQAKALIDEGIERNGEDAAMYLVAARASGMVGNDARAMKYLKQAQKLEEGRIVKLGINLPLSYDPTSDLEPEPEAALAQIVRRVVDEGDEPAADTEGAPRAGLMAQVYREMEQIKARHRPSMEAGLAFRFRGGEAGLSRLTEVGVPVRVELPTGYRGRLNLRVRPVLVTSGNLDGQSPTAAERFGTYGTVSLALPDEAARRAFGVELGIGYGWRGYKVWVGSSPIGFALPTVTGGFEVGESFEMFGFRLHGERSMVNDSLLSYAGETDPLSGKIWGGVTRNGASLDLSLSRNRFLVFLYGGFYGLIGTDVQINTQWRAGAGLQWTVLDLSWGQLVTGVAANLFGYQFNLRHFTFGHGGYFSPQFFVNAHLPVMLRGSKGNFEYSVEAQVGLNWFREDEIEWFPGSNNLMDARAAVVDADGAPVQLFYEGRAPLSFALNAAGHVAYQITPRLQARLDLSIYTAAEYWEFVGGIGVQVRFGKLAPREGALVRALTQGTGSFDSRSR